jgi:hypothetical protein
MFFGVLKTGFLINQKSVRYLRISGIWHFFVVQNANFKNSGRDNLCKLFCPGAVNCLHSIGLGLNGMLGRLQVWNTNMKDIQYTHRTRKQIHTQIHPGSQSAGEGCFDIQWKSLKHVPCKFLQFHTPGCVRVTISAVFNALLTRTGQFTFK